MYIHSDCFLISIENAGGAGLQLLDYSFLAMYDPKREKPWHHGGILIHYPDVYELVVNGRPCTMNALVADVKKQIYDSLRKAFRR